MRIVAAAALAVLAVGSTAAGAKADPYPWCALYGGDLGGVRSCHFFTVEQCRAAVSGVGGQCQPNPWYTGSVGPDPRRPRPR